MPGVSAEQVARAREVDLLSYLQASEPNELRKSGPNEYRTATHGSLVISNGKWIWFRGGFGGRSALDYLIKIRGMKFVEAVETVLGSRAAPAAFSSLPDEPPPKRTFYPPKPLRYSNRAVSYLQSRGISPKVISRAMQAGIFYESRYYNPDSQYHNATVCVFAGKDESGKVVYAALRGIDTDLKMDKAGSDKRFNFCIPAKAPDSHHLAVFESPIDALSHATLQQRNGGWGSRGIEDSVGKGGATGVPGESQIRWGGAERLSLTVCGESNRAKSATTWDGHRLSLGGTSSVALTAFLERNPQITRVMLHLDNDAAGLTTARKIKARLAADSRFKRIKVSVNPPRRGKDYNDALLHAINIEREQKQPHRRSADTLI